MHEAVMLYLYVFGVLTVAGGIMGFVKAQSVPSLIAGFISGCALIAAGYLLGPAPKAGLVLGLVVSVALAGRFTGAFRKTRKVMPAGLMMVLGILGAVLTAAGLAKG